MPWTNQETKTNLTIASLPDFMGLFEVFDSPKHRKLFKHGQYPLAFIGGSFGKSVTKATEESAERVLKANVDDFHSPCRPVDYIEYRVQQMLRFYQRRLPVYDSIKFRVSIFLLIGAFSGAILSLIGIPTWTAVATAIVGGVTAWSEFHGTEDKLVRYSDAVTQIESIVLWWTTLPVVDQANVSKISQLVNRCESVFRDERQAWVSLNIEQDNGKGGAGDSKKDADMVKLGTNLNNMA